MIDVAEDHEYYGTCGLALKSKNFDESCDSDNECQVELTYQGVTCD